jgi:hypothetical protein
MINVDVSSREHNKTRKRLSHFCLLLTKGEEYENPPLLEETRFSLRESFHSSSTATEFRR